MVLAIDWPPAQAILTDPSASRLSTQNRTSLFVPLSTIQKFNPSLQAPTGDVLAPVEKVPMDAQFTATI
jgi:hypothetical protein